MSTVSQDNYVMEIASPQQDWAKQKKTAQKRRVKLGGKIKHADSQPVSGISLRRNCRESFFMEKNSCQEAAELQLDCNPRDN